MPHTLRHVHHHLVTPPPPPPPHVVRASRPHHLCPWLHHLQAPAPPRPVVWSAVDTAHPSPRPSNYPIRLLCVTNPTATHARVRGQRGNEAGDKHGMLYVPRVGRVRFQRPEVRRRTRDHPIGQQLCESRLGSWRPGFG